MTFRPDAKLDPSRVKDSRRHGAVTRNTTRQTPRSGAPSKAAPAKATKAPKKGPR